MVYLVDNLTLLFNQLKSVRLVLSTSHSTGTSHTIVSYQDQAVFSYPEIRKNILLLFNTSHFVIKQN